MLRFLDRAFVESLSLTHGMTDDFQIAASL